MSAQHHAVPEPVGGPLLNKVTFIAGTLVAIMAAILLYRFIFGLGAVTNLSDGYPWGIWIVVDVMIGSAFACGGFSVAMLVYIFNKGEYHPLVRPALLASLLGYTLAGAGVIFDLGRWWNVWNMYWPWSVNPNSVMFEVAICITLYIVVMWIEFAPVFLEKLGLKDMKRKLNKFLFIVIALGTLLPMMHQSSLGTLWVVLGTQVHPLWQTPLIPALFLLSAIIMGYAVVLFESCIASSAYRRSIEVSLLNPMARIMLGVVAAYLAVRLGDVIFRGVIGRSFALSLEGLMFWLEMACFIAPFFLIGREVQRRNPARLFVAGILLMLGGSLLRLNGFLIGYDTGAGFSYFPSLSEILVTAGMFATEVFVYVIVTRRFPVLPREAPAH
ncbi:MAG: Ni/Fe-hydrogenase cytochrome b subunit [Gammaproteobacteria bacterium]|nr:Ni/Fe-hydrogenase cytochrome b subunit [Gammaproteobacteria bacterium]MBU1647274.1 Ni/Fe-hydrogenase cytochrome b subunit [Gammaproteobacteria bacterium]MBU1972786.1 Ni/Fe-hydrogenase cytochrome b subunit [Gammaproteobacteria bacterium]